MARTRLTDHNCPGFTLIGLVTMLSVASVLLALAVPNFSAYSRSISVTPCTNTDGVACNGSNHWDAGWIVFTDVLGEFDIKYRGLPSSGNRDVTVQGDRTFLLTSARVY